MIKNRMDLKGLSKELSLDLNQNKEWLDREISFAIDGSYNSEKLNKDIVELYDIKRDNRGKRANNLVAQIGLFYISTYYNLNTQQSLTVYKYLSNEDKLIYRNIVIDNLDYYMENLEDWNYE